MNNNYHIVISIFETREIEEIIEQFNIILPVLSRTIIGEIIQPIAVSTL